MMLGSTDSQILAGADKWRWTPSGTREHKFDRFVMSIYPEGWNRNFVELDLGASGDANVFAQVVAADRPRLGENCRLRSTHTSPARSRLRSSENTHNS